MARQRKGVAYRALERPYTRISKFNKKQFTRGNPHINISQFEMGNKTKKFPFCVDLIAEDNLQIRHTSMESARQASNRYLEKNLGKEGYHFKFKIYPHHILRENPLASGAGADRMSTGMKKSFGKTIGKAAQVKKGKQIICIGVEEKHTKVAKRAMTLAKNKLACKYSIKVYPNPLFKK
ncbi:50S ribosomal protein L16 [Candidatus Woesearchaeota archaeon]|nr:50S ribosomal protein L16 [Candidatus Woesearchaeota archaeon]MBW3013958.1 50S ribosomal protein L16 [Candidatus Woesearchaeota archaeon]